jgi:hypothetical protein
MQQTAAVHNDAVTGKVVLAGSMGGDCEFARVDGQVVEAGPETVSAGGVACRFGAKTVRSTPPVTVWWSRSAIQRFARLGAGRPPRRAGNGAVALFVSRGLDPRFAAG